MFLIDKQNGLPKDNPDAWRPITQLVKLNEYVQPGEYNAEPIGLLIQRLEGGKMFNKFDICDAYLNLELKSDQPIIAKIPGQSKNFKYLRCPQGLRVASCEFNNACEEIFQGVPLIRYSDDCTQKASSESELLESLDLFLSRCVERNVPLKLRKCVFGAEEMEFLSYKVFDGHVGISDAHRKAVEEIDGSTLKRDTLAGFLAYFDSFHGDYDLLNCLRSDSPWDDNKELALTWLKQKILNAPLKALVDFKSPLKLFVDASDTGYSSALFIEKSERNKKFIEPVSFFKQNTSKLPSWQNKSTYQRELFALVASVKRYEYLLKGSHPVDIYCDNKAVVESKNSKSQQIRHFFETLKIEYPNAKIHHCVSKNNTVADILSRGEHTKVTENHIKVEIPVEKIFSISERTRSKSKKGSETNAKTRVLNPDILDQPNLLPNAKSSENEKMLLKLTNFHIRSGHISPERVFSLYKRVYGPNHESKVTREQLEQRFKSCKCYSPKPKGNFIPVKPSINAELYLDFKTIGSHHCPLKNGKKAYRLSIIEPLSGAIWSIPVPVTTGPQLVDIMSTVLQVHGLVGMIKADNAPSFIYGEFQNFCKKYEIKLQSITPANAQANLAERQHSSQNKALNLASKICDKISVEEAKEVLFDFSISHNLIKKRNTPFSPLEILKGQLPPECISIFDQSEIEQTSMSAHQITEKTWLDRSKEKLQKTTATTNEPKFKTDSEVYWRVKNPTTEVQYRKGKVIDSNPTSTLLKLTSGKYQWVVNRFLISKPEYDKLLGFEK